MSEEELRINDVHPQASGKHPEPLNSQIELGGRQIGAIEIGGNDKGEVRVYVTNTKGQNITDP